MTGLATVLDSTESWSSLVLAASWQVALLALLACALERVLRPPRARYALWWFVLLAPLVLAPLRLGLQERHALAAVPAPPALARVAAVQVVPAPPAPRVPASGEPQPIVIEDARRYWSRLEMLSLLERLWLLGAATLALRLVIGHRRLRTLVRRSRPVAEGPAAEALRWLQAEAGVPRTSLRASAEVGAIVLCGLRRPVVLIPEGWLRDLQPAELRALLAHEVAHVRRRDVMANLAQRLVEALLFFHPVVWLASGRVTTAREEACDAWAVGRGAGAADYARCLTRAAARARVGLSVASVGLAERRSHLRRRVEAVMKLSGMSTGSRHIALAAATVLVVCAVGLASVRMEGTAPASGQAGAAPAPAVPAAVEVTLPGGPLSRKEAEAAAHYGAPGMTAYRLAFEVPFTHEVRLDVDEYRNGKVTRSVVEDGLGGAGVAAGADTLLLLAGQNDGEVKLRYAFLSASGNLGTNADHTVPLVGLAGARGAGLFAVRQLEVGVRTPVWYFSADGSERAGASPPRAHEVLPEFLARHDLVVVAFATLTPTDRPHFHPAPAPQANVTAEEFWRCSDYAALTRLLLERWHSNVTGTLDGHEVTGVAVAGPEDHGNGGAPNGLRFTDVGGRGIATYYQPATGRTYIWGKVRVQPTNVVVENDAVDSRGRPLRLNRTKKQ
jgi:beta-lactamase regulating signal transducer with metallopeptidase domain